MLPLLRRAADLIESEFATLLEYAEAFFERMEHDFDSLTADRYQARA
jgi:hypothetical protein